MCTSKSRGKRKSTPWSRARRLSARLRGYLVALQSIPASRLRRLQLALPRTCSGRPAPSALAAARRRRLRRQALLSARRLGSSAGRRSRTWTQTSTTTRMVSRRALRQQQQARQSAHLRRCSVAAAPSAISSSSEKASRRRNRREPLRCRRRCSELAATMTCSAPHLRVARGRAACLTRRQTLVTPRTARWMASRTAVAPSKARRNGRVSSARPPVRCLLWADPVCSSMR